MSLERVLVTDWERARQDGVLLGTAFAFVGGDNARVVSLLGPGAAALPGLSVAALPLPELRLTGIVSDKALYRAGRDTVHLLALRLGLSDTEARLLLRRDGASPTSVPVRFDRTGLATAILRDLTTGDYEVRWDGLTDEPPCCFTVAEYRLAPLVADLHQRRLLNGGARLALALRLETFGVPVEGGVRLELTEGGRRIHSTQAVAVHGLVEVEFALGGAGPHAVNVQLEANPGRTATVPLVGSRAAERAPTLFSPLGTEVTGALLPGPDAREVRGLYLCEGAVRNTPFALERVDTISARLRARVATGPVCVVVADLTDATRRIAVQRDNLAAGEVIEVEAVGPASAVAVGAFVQGAPWEGWATVLRPVPAPVVTVPTTCRPGSEVTLAVDPGQSGASVYLVVKDARLLSADTPVSRLAGHAKAAVEALAGMLSVTKPGAVNGFVSLADGLSAPQAILDLLPESVARENVVFPLALCDDALVVAMPDPIDFDKVQRLEFILNRRVRAVVAPRDLLVAAICRHYGQTEVQCVDSMLAELTDTAIDFTETEADDFDDEDFDDEDFDDEGPDDDVFEETAVDEDAGERDNRSRKAPLAATLAEPEVLFAGLMSGVGSYALTLRLPDTFADYVVEAFVVSGLDWASAKGRFRAAKDPFVSLDLPPFVHPGDSVLGRVHAGASSGRMRLRVARDGMDVPLHHEGEPLPPGAEIAAHRAELAFAVVPGDYEAVVEDVGAGVSDRSVRRVEALGKLRAEVRALRFLRPGEALSRADDPSVVGLRVLPGLDRPFGALVEATADYAHHCCEQTAAKLRAGCAMWGLADADERRQRAATVLCAGVHRLARMWLRGRGFKVYPECPDQPHPYLGPVAARYLWDLELLRPRVSRLSPALAEAVEQGLEMARDATAAYGLDWPPKAPRAAEDVYAVLRSSADAPARAKATQRARELVDLLSGGATNAGAVRWRAEAAYAAAALLRAGEGLDRVLPLANRVVAQFNEQGRLYSTLDSAAAVALMTELQAQGVINAGGKAIFDGQLLSLTKASGLSAKAVRAVEGVLAVEVTRLVEEDWEQMAITAPVRVALEKDGRARQRFTVGDALTLRVALEDGYRAGDLLWVCLPDALSRLLGGGQVKRFSVDFRGQNELALDLAATGATTGPQHFAVCVRNMFEEERVGNPGRLAVTVGPASG